MKKLWIVLLLLCFLFLTSCSGERLVEYEDPLGYAFSIAESWQEVSDRTLDEREKAFVSEDGSLSFSLIVEAAGMDYFKLVELRDQLIQSFVADLFAEHNIQSLGEDETTAQAVVTGTDLEGESLVVYVAVVEPIPALRFFFVFTTDEGYYQSHSELLASVVSSLHLVKSTNEIYATIYEQIEEDAAAQQEESTEEKEQEDSLAPESTPD